MVRTNRALKPHTKAYHWVEEKHQKPQAQSLELMPEPAPAHRPLRRNYPNIPLPATNSLKDGEGGAARAGSEGFPEDVIVRRSLLFGMLAGKAYDKDSRSREACCGLNRG